MLELWHFDEYFICVLACWELEIDSLQKVNCVEANRSCRKKPISGDSKAFSTNKPQRLSTAGQSFFADLQRMVATESWDSAVKLVNQSYENQTREKR